MEIFQQVWEQDRIALSMDSEKEHLVEVCESGYTIVENSIEWPNKILLNDVKVPLYQTKDRELNPRT